MINTRVQSKQDYIKELKQQIDSKPSKLDQYKQKLNEREMYEKDNMFDYFGRAGGGAPLRNEDGRVKTTRRTMLNDNYEELTMNNQNKENNNNYNNYYNDLQEQYKQQIQQQMINNGQNQMMNQQMIPQPMMQPQMNMLPYQDPNINYQQNSLYNTHRNLTPYQQIQQYNQMNNGAYMPNNTAGFMNTPSYLQQEMNNANYHIQNSINNISSNNNYRNVQSARPPLINPNINNINNDINFNEVKIIPIEHQKNANKEEVQKKMLRDDWIKQIEDKKQRLKEEKQKQIEKDRIEEMKYQKYLEEQKEAEKAQKYQNEQFNQSPMSPQSNSQSNLNQQPQSHTPLSLSNRANYSNQDNKSNNNSGLNQSFGILRNNSANNLTSNMISNIQPPMLNYATISRNLDDTINDQIAKLRNDVSLQYVEMSNLFNKLKMDVAEANQLKGEAERELKYIRDELLKTKMNNILYENKLNQVLERNAPYNNLHIPFNEVDPFNGAHNRIQSGKNLQSTSSMVFANDMVNEGNINRVRELSSLAQVGQSLVGESEFIPIQTTNEDITPNVNTKNNEVNNSNENSTKILDDYMKKGDYQDMYKKLVDIANINHQMNPEAKVRTIGKNLEVDYDAINSRQGQKEEIKKLDDMLKDIVEKSNKYS